MCFEPNKAAAHERPEIPAPTMATSNAAAEHVVVGIIPRNGIAGGGSDAGSEAARKRAVEATLSHDTYQSCSRLPITIHTCPMGRIIFHFGRYYVHKTLCHHTSLTLPRAEGK